MLGRVILQHLLSSWDTVRSEGESTKSMALTTVAPLLLSSMNERHIDLTTEGGTRVPIMNVPPSALLPVGRCALRQKVVTVIGQRSQEGCPHLALEERRWG